MTVFCYMMAEYAFRRFTDRPFRKPDMASYAEAAVPMSARTMDRSMKLLITGICVSTALIYIWYVTHSRFNNVPLLTTSSLAGQSTESSSSLMATTARSRTLKCSSVSFNVFHCSSASHPPI